MKTRRLLFPSNLQLIDLMSADDAESDASIMSEVVIDKTYAHFLFHKHIELQLGNPQMSLNVMSKRTACVDWKRHCVGAVDVVGEFCSWQEVGGALKAQWCPDCEWLANGDLNSGPGASEKGFVNRASGEPAMSVVDWNCVLVPRIFALQIVYYVMKGLLQQSVIEFQCFPLMQNALLSS